MNPTSKKISSLSDKRFLKLLGNVKAELQERAQREPQTKKTAQKTGQLNDLSAKGLQVLLVDLISEVEKRFFVPADSDSDVPPVSKDRVRVSQLDMAQQRLTRLDIGIVTANTDAQVANTTKSNTIPSAKSESCKMDELTPPLSSKSRFPAESTQIESVTENGADRVIKVAEICKASLGYLVKCYKAPITASPGIIIKQMKESVSLLRDLSKVTEEFMESLLLLSKLENEHDNLIVFLDCVLEFLGSSVKVIMAKFNPAITPAASEVQAIKLEINKVLFMMNALQVSLSTSPDLEISTLQEECPSFDMSNSQSTTTILDFHTNFQRIPAHALQNPPRLSPDPSLIILANNNHAPSRQAPGHTTRQPVPNNQSQKRGWRQDGERGPPEPRGGLSRT